MGANVNIDKGEEIKKINAANNFDVKGLKNKGEIHDDEKDGEFGFMSPSYTVTEDSGRPIKGWYSIYHKIQMDA